MRKSRSRERTYPALQDVILLIADQVLPSETEKLNLLGFYAGTDILLPKGAFSNPEKGLPALTSLVLIAWVRKGIGTFKTHAELFDPAENRLVETPRQDSVKKSDGTLTLVFSFTPFFFPAPGRYQFLVYLDEKAYPLEFNVRERS